MSVFRRSLQLFPDTGEVHPDFGNRRGSRIIRVVCASWLWEYTDLPRSVTSIDICIANYSVSGAFRAHLTDALLRVDKKENPTATFVSLNRLIQQHGRKIGQGEWIAWIWFEYTP